MAWQDRSSTSCIWKQTWLTAGTTGAPSLPAVLVAGAAARRQLSRSSFAFAAAGCSSAGSVRTGFGESMRRDLVLAATSSRTRRPRTRVLMHVGARRETVDAPGVSSVQEVLDARGIPAVAEAGPRAVQLRWSLEAWPKVSIVVPTRHNRPMLSTLLPGLARTDYPSSRCASSTMAASPPTTTRGTPKMRRGSTCTCCGGPRLPFNYSKVNNAAVRNCTGDVLVFLNDDIELPDPRWLRELVGWAQQPEIGLAGLQMTRSDGRIQHAGVILGLGGFADHVFEGMPPQSDSMLGPTGWYRNVLSVTGACAAVRRELFERSAVSTSGSCCAVATSRSVLTSRRPATATCVRRTVACGTWSLPLVGRAFRPRTSSRATGVTTPGSSGATPTTRRTCLWSPQAETARATGAHTGAAPVGSDRARPSGVPATQRRRGGCDARGLLPDQRRRHRSRFRLARTACGGFRHPHDQLVHP